LVLLDLHPLALEDVFHGHSQNRSKADYYTRHLFLRVLCHELVDDISQNGTTSQFTNAARSDSPEPIGEPEVDDDMKDLDEATQNGGSANLGSLNKRRSRLGGYPLLPTTRADVKPVYEGNQKKANSHLTKLIANEKAVGIISL